MRRRRSNGMALCASRPEKAQPASRARLYRLSFWTYRIRAPAFHPTLRSASSIRFTRPRKEGQVWDFRLQHGWWKCTGVAFNTRRAAAAARPSASSFLAWIVMKARLLLIEDDPGTGPALR